MSWPRPLTVLATALLTAVVGVPTGSPAVADLPCDPRLTATRVPDAVTYATGSALVAASVTATDACSDGIGGTAGIATVEMGLPNSEFFPVRRSSGTPQQGTWTTHLRFTRAGITGRIGLHIKVTDLEGHVAMAVRPFHVRRNTLITRNATPEPVVKGGDVTVRGTLRRLTPTGSYVAYRARPVDYYFRPAGSSTRVLRGTSTTSRFGSFRKSFQSNRAGTWYVRFPGTTSLAAGTSIGDFVDMR